MPPRKSKAKLTQMTPDNPAGWTPEISELVRKFPALKRWWDNMQVHMQDLSNDDQYRWMQLVVGSKNIDEPHTLLALVLKKAHNKMRAEYRAITDASNKVTYQLVQETMSTAKQRVQEFFRLPDRVSMTHRRMQVVRPERTEYSAEDDPTVDMDDESVGQTDDSVSEMSVAGGGGNRIDYDYDMQFDGYADGVTVLPKQYTVAYQVLKLGNTTRDMLNAIQKAIDAQPKRFPLHSFISGLVTTRQPRANAYHANQDIYLALVQANAVQGVELATIASMIGSRVHMLVSFLLSSHMSRSYTAVSSTTKFDTNLQTLLKNDTDMYPAFLMATKVVQVLRQLARKYKMRLVYTEYPMFLTTRMLKGDNLKKFLFESRADVIAYSLQTNEFSIIELKSLIGRMVMDTFEQGRTTVPHGPSKNIINKALRQVLSYAYVFKRMTGFTVNKVIVLAISRDLTTHHTVLDLSDDVGRDLYIKVKGAIEDKTTPFDGYESDDSDIDLYTNDSNLSEFSKVTHYTIDPKTNETWYRVEWKNPASDQYPFQWLRESGVHYIKPSNQPIKTTWAQSIQMQKDEYKEAERQKKKIY